MVKSYSILRRFYPSLIWKINTSKKIIYLTFDDGPIPEVTQWVLSELKKYQAKATFFCIGENVVKHTNLFKDIIAENHTIGNHTFNHLNGWKTNNMDYFSNIEKAEQVFKTKLFRPPYGKIGSSQISQLKTKYKIIMWDVLSYDFDSEVSPETCAKNVINNATQGSIIVFHDSLKASKNLYYALPKTLAHFSELGYRFDAIPPF